MRMMSVSASLALLWGAALVAAQTNSPSASPSFAPSFAPSYVPSASPTQMPSSAPSSAPSAADDVTTSTPTSVPTGNTDTRPPPVCSITTSISCLTGDNQDCATLRSTGAICDVVDGPQSSLTFMYNMDLICEMSSNQQGTLVNGEMKYDAICQDKRPLITNIGMRCLDNATGNRLSVSPAIVSSGQSFTVTARRNGPLPPLMKCTVYTLEAVELQVNIIQTTTDIELKDNFGSLVVTGCGDKDCFYPISMTYTIENIGEVTAKFVDVDRESALDTQNRGILGSFPTTELNPTEIMTATEDFEIDICELTSLETTIAATAGDGIPNQCTSSFVYGGELEATCAVAAELTCEYLGEPCDQIVSKGNPGCYCQECVSEMTFQYTGAACADGEDGCSDSNGGPPGAAFVEINGVGGGTFPVYFQGVLSPGDFVTISRVSGCLEPSLTVIVRDKDVMGLGYQVKVITHDCSDSGGIELDGKYGAMTFIGFKCKNGSEQSCLANIDYTACGINEGPTPCTLTGMSLSAGEESYSLLEGTPELTTGKSYCTSKSVEINLCGEKEYEASLAVEADYGTQEVCVDESGFTFEPEAPVETSPPTDVPTSNIATQPPPTSTTSSTVYSKGGYYRQQPQGGHYRKQPRYSYNKGGYSTGGYGKGIPGGYGKGIPGGNKKPGYKVNVYPVSRGYQNARKRFYHSH